MWAAADYGEHENTPDEPQPPRELIWYWNLSAFGLPHAGGWMEQPAGLVDRIRQVGWVYESFKARRAIESGGLAKWKKENPAMARTVKQIERMRQHDAD